MQWLDNDDPLVDAARQQYRESTKTKDPIGQAPNAPGQIKIKRGKEYQMRKISWSWPGWLARGKLHILGGQKGTGKSTIAFDLFALPDALGRPLRGQCPERRHRRQDNKRPQPENAMCHDPLRLDGTLDVIRRPQHSLRLTGRPASCKRGNRTLQSRA